ADWRCAATTGSRTGNARPTARWRTSACRPAWRRQRPPPPPPPPPPPENPPPPEKPPPLLPEELPGGVADEAICVVRLLPSDWLKLPRSPMPLPWYQLIAVAAAAVAAAPAARVNFFVQASSTSSATAYGS